MYLLLIKTIYIYKFFISWFKELSIICYHKNNASVSFSTYCLTFQWPHVAIVRLVSFAIPFFGFGNCVIGHWSLRMLGYNACKHVHSVLLSFRLMAIVNHQWILISPSSANLKVVLEITFLWRESFDIFDIKFSIACSNTPFFSWYW